MLVELSEGRIYAAPRFDVCCLGYRPRWHRVRIRTRTRWKLVPAWAAPAGKPFRVVL